MVETVEGILVGWSITSRKDGRKGHVIIETETGERRKFFVTKQTVGDLPTRGSAVIIEYVGNQVKRIVTQVDFEE
jgi:hypothetical protein